jgi:hypothetical protein
MPISVPARRLNAKEAGRVGASVATTYQKVLIDGRVVTAFWLLASLAVVVAVQSVWV